MYKYIKRIFDVVASLLAIIIFLIPWLIIALIIKIQSPGPVIYKGRRIGLDGKVFTLYKFRSMRVDSGGMHAITLRDDPRIFSFGRFLRTSKLDETPQLINIIKGDMSIIGPRPEAEENSGKFYIGRYEKILSVKPGLSSPASLYNYIYGELYPDEETYIKEFLSRKLDLELYYIEHRSLLYDMQIIVRTVATIIKICLGKQFLEESREIQELKIVTKT